VGDAPICPHCGGPMTSDVALVNFGGKRKCERVVMPPHCPSEECRAARDEAAIARLVERGVIDP